MRNEKCIRATEVTRYYYQLQNAYLVCDVLFPSEEPVQVETDTVEVIDDLSDDSLDIIIYDIHLIGKGFFHGSKQ